MAETAGSCTGSCKEMVGQIPVVWATDLVGRARFADPAVRPVPGDMARAQGGAQTAGYEQEMRRKAVGGAAVAVGGGAGGAAVGGGVNEIQVCGVKRMKPWMIPTWTGRRTTMTSEGQNDRGSPLVLVMERRGKGQEKRMHWNQDGDARGQARATYGNIRQNDG